MHVLGSCEASAQYSPINFFVNLFHSKNSNLPHCFSDLIHTEYRKLHKNNGHPPFFLPPIMRSSVGQCRNIRFRQLYASHVIITSDLHRNLPPTHTRMHAQTDAPTHTYIMDVRVVRILIYLTYLIPSFRCNTLCIHRSTLAVVSINNLERDGLNFALVTSWITDPMLLF